MFIKSIRNNVSILKPNNTFAILSNIRFVSYKNYSFFHFFIKIYKKFHLLLAMMRLHKRYFSRPLYYPLPMNIKDWNVGLQIFGEVDANSIYGRPERKTNQ